jgi:ubiquinol-cytochrome c reductase iron-sulfur subunit
VSKLEPGQRMTVEWRGKPVWILNRSPEMIERTESIDASRLADPDSSVPQQPAYVEGPLRSIKPEIGVIVGICTHLGCSPLFKPEPDAEGVGVDDWPGGFFCPCHGSRFDLAGRVFRNVPAPTNLVVPPYRFDSDVLITVGEDEETA